MVRIRILLADDYRLSLKPNNDRRNEQRNPTTIADPPENVITF